MAKLIVNPTSVNRREIPLARTTILTIGRDPSNDLGLPDAMVSRRHAVIEHRSGQFFLRDCSSANGSVVNGDRVSERGLRDGDLVAIGSMRLLFREELAEPASSGKVVLHPSSAPLACPSCGGEYRRGDLFCRAGGCGAFRKHESGGGRGACQGQGRHPEVVRDAAEDRLRGSEDGRARREALHHRILPAASRGRV